MTEDLIFAPYKDLVNKISTSKQKLKQKEYLSDGSIPVVDQGQELIGGYTNDEKKELKCKLPVIVFGDHTKCVKLLTFPFAPGADGTKVLEPKKGILPKYLACLTEVLVWKIKDKGYARHYQYIEKEQFPIVPLTLQRAIVGKLEELFSSLDSGTSDLKKAQEQLKVYRQALLKKAFEGELTKEWREKQIKLPSSEELFEQIEQGRQTFFSNQLNDWKILMSSWKENGCVGKKPVKPRPLTVPDPPNDRHNEIKWEIPPNWIWTQIGTICFVTKLAGFEYTDFVNYDENGDLPVIKAENAGKNGFKNTDFSKVNSESVKMLTRSQLFGGELLIVFVGNVGNVAMVPHNERYFLGPNIGMARPYFKLNSRYLELFLQSAFGRSLLMSAVKAVAQPSLSMGTIRQAPIAFPSIEEQNEIVKEIETHISVCDKVEADLQTSLNSSQSLRQSILKKAFEGKLLTEEEIEKCKKEHDYEPADVLLKKIKAEKKKK